MKFHLIAVVLIVLIVSIIHMVMQPAALPPRVVTVVQYSPVIVDATWGRNCNDRIAQASSMVPAGPRPIIPDASTQNQPLKPVARNNVLEKVKALCADKENCTFKADNATLGALLSSCRNQLEIQFYCSETERVRRLSLQEGSDVTLDCSYLRR